MWKMNQSRVGGGLRIISWLLGACWVLTGCGQMVDPLSRMPHWVHCNVQSDFVSAQFQFFPEKRHFVRCTISSPLEGLGHLIVNVDSPSLTVTSVIEDTGDSEICYAIENLPDAKDNAPVFAVTRVPKSIWSEKQDPYGSTGSISAGLLPSCGEHARIGHQSSRHHARGSISREGALNVWIAFSTTGSGNVGNVEVMQIDRNCDGIVDLEFDFTKHDCKIRAFVDLECDGVFDVQVIGDSSRPMSRVVGTTIW